MRRVRLGTLVAVVLTALSAGCTHVSSGEPRAADAASTSEPGTTAPSRPREIPLDDVDPCTLLPEADYPDYHLDEPGEPGTNDRGADNCLWFGDIAYLGVTLVTYEGIEAQEGRLGDRWRVDPIEGYPSFASTLPGDEKACFVAADVAEGQYLEVQVGLYTTSEELPPVCEYAHRFASSLMGTLVTS